jgi:hypothetical protein
VRCHPMLALDRNAAGARPSTSPPAPPIILTIFTNDSPLPILYKINNINTHDCIFLLRTGR